MSQAIIDGCASSRGLLGAAGATGTPVCFASSMTGSSLWPATVTPPGRWPWSPSRKAPSSPFRPTSCWRPWCWPDRIAPISTPRSAPWPRCWAVCWATPSASSVLGKADTFEASKALFQQHGAWVILIKGLTPIPFKLITIASGIFQFNLALFVALCVITRGARFFLVAFVLKRWGEPMLAVIEKRLALFTVLFLVLLVGAVFAVKLVGH